MKKSGIVLLVASLILIFSCSKKDVADGGVPSELTAHFIMGQMEKVYAECSTYQDSGVNTTLFFHDTLLTNTVVKSFKMAFLRTGQFRFQYHEIERDRLYIIIRDKENKAYRWWTLHPEEEEKESLYSALAAAAGVSSGTSLIIPELLLPKEIEPYRIRNLENIARLNDDFYNGEDCYKIQGYESDGDERILWIIKSSYLLVKMTSGHQFDTFRTESTMVINDPRINVEIDPEDLEFGHPEGWF